MFALPAVSLVLIFFVGAVLRKLGIASRNDGLVLLRLVSWLFSHRLARPRP